MTVFGAPTGINDIEESGDTMVSLGEYGEIHKITADTMQSVEDEAMALV